MKKIHIEWNKVTWASQSVAVVLFVGVFALGFWLGVKYEYHAFVNALTATTQPQEVEEVSFIHKIFNR